MSELSDTWGVYDDEGDLVEIFADQDEAYDFAQAHEQTPNSWAVEPRRDRGSDRIGNMLTVLAIAVWAFIAAMVVSFALTGPNQPEPLPPVTCPSR